MGTDWMAEDGVDTKGIEEVVSHLEQRGYISVNWGLSAPGRIRFKCPNTAHDDDNASCDLSLDKGLYYCHGCGGGGNIYGLWKKVVRCHVMDARRSIRHIVSTLETKEHEAVKEFREPVKQKNRRYLMRINHEVVDAYHNRLKWDRGLMEKLRQEAGLGPETVDRFKLGYDDSSQRWAIPILAMDGIIRNIRMYRTGRSPKCIHWREVCPDGETVDQTTLLGEWYVHMNRPKTVALCEGEADCLRLWQAKIPALTPTGGVQQWKTLKERVVRILAGSGVKNVVVTTDWDPIGNKVALGLREYFARMGFNVTRPELGRDGVKDIRDYLDQGGGVARIMGGVDGGWTV